MYYQVMFEERQDAGVDKIKRGEFDAFVVHCCDIVECENIADSSICRLTQTPLSAAFKCNPPLDRLLFLIVNWLTLSQ